MADRMTRRHEESGLDYILGKTKAVFSNGQLATREEFDRWEKKGTIAQELKRLESDPDRNNWDFKYAVSTGDLRQRRKSRKPYGTTRRTKQKEEWQRPEKRFSSAILIEAAMLLVGLGGGIMSAHHTSMFLIEGGKPAWVGWTTGVGMILFSTTAFALARILSNKLSPLVVAIGFLVVSFSMFSAVAVNFDSFQRRDDGLAVAAVESDEALAAHRRALSLGERELEENAAELTRLESEADYWKDKSWARHDAYASQAEAARLRRQELLAAQLERELRVPDLAEEAAASQAGDTIYALLGRLFKMKEDAVRFAAYAAPSVFYDLVAPLALSVALILEDDRRKKAKGVSSE